MVVLVLVAVAIVVVVVVIVVVVVLVVVVVVVVIVVATTAGIQGPALFSEPHWPPCPGWKGRDPKLPGLIGFWV